MLRPGPQLVAQLAVLGETEEFGGHGVAARTQIQQADDDLEQNQRDDDCARDEKQASARTGPGGGHQPVQSTTRLSM